MAPTALPPAFIARMRALLGAEADAFFASYARPTVSGLRVNTLKTTPGAFAAISPWPLDPVPWTPDGYFVADDARPGRHPFHAAGLYYLQEPSAMAVVEALDVRPGQAVLDLAAAPGGKATQIAAKLGGSGLLVANELVGNRVKALGENLERWGTTQTVLTNDDPARIADAFGPMFDRVLLDAPCSGEGMFRKSTIAIREWSPEHVAGSAARQTKILRDAARLVAPGGLLLYSTCTFAVEENEGQIDCFLTEHPGWELVQIPPRHGLAPGRSDWVPTDRPLTHTVRLWPHKLAGEGHFLALLRAPETRSPGDALRTNVPVRETSRSSADGSIGTDAFAAWRAFVDEALIDPPGWLCAGRPRPERLRLRGDMLFSTVDGAAIPEGIRIVRPGLALGAPKPGRFEPAHALALALPAAAVRRVVDCSIAEAEHYLAGETLHRPGDPGWTLVTVEGRPLGWGRRTGDIVKNHYPKGLRRPL